MQSLPGHRDAISGLAFRQGTHDLYSCAFDRTLKLWSCDDCTYVDTLFGHQVRLPGREHSAFQLVISTTEARPPFKLWLLGMLWQGSCIFSTGIMYARHSFCDMCPVCQLCSAVLCSMALFAFAQHAELLTRDMGLMYTAPSIKLIAAMLRPCSAG